MSISSSQFAPCTGAMILPRFAQPKMQPSLIRRSACLLVLLCVAAGSAHSQAQISLTTAVDLALRNSPRVRMAQADVAKARAILSQSRDVYIPSLSGGAGLGQGYGYSPNPPTLFTFSGGSLVYNGSQLSYIRSARAGVKAAELSLKDVRESVAEDAALTFVAFLHDQERVEALTEQTGYAANLVNIVGERFDAGRDNQIDLTQAKLTAAQIHLGLLKSQDDVANNRAHLAGLTGLPADTLHADGGFPSTIPLPEERRDTATPVNAAVASSFANAAARQQSAIGDTRYLYRPQVSLVVQYNRYATFTNSFQQLERFNGSIGANAQFYGVLINVPIFDKFRQAKARESAADAAHAFGEAHNAQFLAIDGQARLRHTIAEVQARAEVASLEQQLAKQQLDVVMLQVQSGNPNGPPISPKEQQNARINERGKYLNFLDATFQLRQAQVSLLRQNGQLEDWLSSTLRSQPLTPGQPPP